MDMNGRILRRCSRGMRQRKRVDELSGHTEKVEDVDGGEGGIRTPDTVISRITV